MVGFQVFDESVEYCPTQDCDGPAAASKGGSDDIEKSSYTEDEYDSGDSINGAMEPESDGDMTGCVATNQPTREVLR